MECHLKKEDLEKKSKNNNKKKIPRDKWKQKHNEPKPTGHSKSSSKREVYSDTSLYQETKKSQIHDITLHLKQLEKEEQTKPKVSRWKIINIRAKNKWNRDEENNSKDQWN